MKVDGVAIFREHTAIELQRAIEGWLKHGKDIVDLQYQTATGYAYKGEDKYPITIYSCLIVFNSSQTEQ